MTLICRAVDTELADCPNCKKKLTIRTLAYKHARYCRAYADRVTQRTVRAQERYNHNVQQMSLPGNNDDTDDDKQMDSVSTSSGESENGDGTTSEGTSNSQNSNNFPGATPEATTTAKRDKKTFGATFETTQEGQFLKKTPAPTFEATAATFFDEKTAEATVERKKTLQDALPATLAAQKTQQATHVTTFRANAHHQGLDVVIANMFHR